MEETAARILKTLNYVILHEALSPERVRLGMDEAEVPEILSEVFPESRARVEALLDELFSSGRAPGDRASLKGPGDGK